MQTQASQSPQIEQERPASPMFTRSGRPVSAYRLSEKGKPFTTVQEPCQRCGGAGGAQKWEHTGWTCFDCGGGGKGHVRTVKLYTAEQLAKLDAAAEKRTARRQSEAAEKRGREAAETEARRAAFLMEHGALLSEMEAHASGNAFLTDLHWRALTQCQLTEGQIAAARTAIAREKQAAASRHIGTVGERIQTAVIVERVSSYERPCFGASWRSETVWIVTLRDEAGNCLVSKSPNFHPEKDERFILRATVKEHSEYQGQAQTVIQRVAARKLATQAQEEE